MLIWVVMQFGAFVVEISWCDTSEHFLSFAAGKLLGGLKPSQEPSTNDAHAGLEPQVGPDGQTVVPARPRPIENVALAWPFGSKLSMHVYLSTDPEGDVFGHKEPLPNFVWDGITFGDWKEARVIDLDVNFSQVTLHTLQKTSTPIETILFRVCDTMDRCGRTFFWSRTMPRQTRTLRITTPFWYTTFVSVWHLFYTMSAPSELNP